MSYTLMTPYCTLQTYATADAAVSAALDYVPAPRPMTDLVSDLEQRGQTTWRAGDRAVSIHADHSSRASFHTATEAMAVAQSHNVSVHP